ncbi:MULTISPECIES: FixH family protein [Mesorhizobium]|uniref:FixH family protein n=2 Tax=Mesorhizobium TaxID=68287 RepID=G6YFX4_9HYPH|nr:MULTISPECIES: FixH family protein [Mesorhizobium]ANT54347.1 cytochrome oxidase [Mesorhizobium amorphae CCNWGS0123]EHH09368.1 FixH family protein [Mesorhizobium amorphae CCNWGS0123]MCV3211825.1 FixH family protein [Mesorhizobium sp. YC-2]MCV3233531.1 FixH family protein [Mesorhizobium sp. YC-39]MCV3241968.1 FixH family protein [Mesorhizobium sp. ZC-5]
MSANTQKSREFTGRHMLFTILAFFGVVIAVNLIMATLANTSWTGLVVENSYVASQEFNKKAEEGRAQASLGWKSRLTIAGGEIRYSLADAAGKPVALHGVKVIFRHPAYEKGDESITLALASGQEYAARHTLRNGVWIIEVDADAGLAKSYREVRRVIVSHGALQ